MAKGFKHGAGGTDALNFKVVGGTEQPENLKGNTVWVNTDTAISGWVFSPEEPAEPSEGLVWIGLGTASPAPFNALKKGGLYCFPASCRQYAGGAWVNAEAYVYTDGAWVQFGRKEVYLYNNGDMCTSVTGGWQARDLGIPSGAKAPTVTVNTSNIKLLAGYNYSSISAGVYEVVNDIDVSGFSALTITVDAVNNITRGAFRIAVFDRSISSWGDESCSNAKASAGITASGTVTIDISSITGPCAIGIMTQNHCSATGPDMTFSQVLLK